MKKEKHLKIYTDENVNIAIVEGLKRRGVEAWSAIEKNKLGLSDEEQLMYAIKEGATIFTHDDDFLSMVAESEVEHCGIIYVHQEKPGDTARSQNYLMIPLFLRIPTTHSFLYHTTSPSSVIKETAYPNRYVSNRLKYIVPLLAV